MDKSDYSSQFGAPFPHPTRPEIYDELIDKAEALHRAYITDWNAYKLAEREARIFLIYAFEKVWYSKMCEPFTFYARVTTKQMLDHLQGICVGNHAIDILDLQDKMRFMHIEHYSIAQYIWALKEAQQQSERAGMPIMDATLVMIATKAIIATHRLPTTKNKW